MFRTRSLTGEQMKAVIDKNRPSQVHKENRGHSLRTLLADKTRKYHQHMEKLTDQLNSGSGRYGSKAAFNSPASRVMKELCNSEQSQIREFCPEQQSEGKDCNTFESIASEHEIQELTSSKAEPMQIIATLQHQPPLTAHLTQSRSAFKLSLQNQQLADQNRQLRRQIENLQQRLQTAQLIRLQKQSEAQSYRLSGKITELKLEELEERARERRGRLRVGGAMGQGAAAAERVEAGVGAGESTGSDAWVQTEDTVESIGRCFQDLKGTSQELRDLKEKVNEIVKAGQLHFGQEIIQIEDHSVQGLFESYSLKIRGRLNQMQEAVKTESAKYNQLEAKSNSRISGLVEMLGLAQKQIKMLLQKLKESNQLNVSNYRQILGQSYRSGTQTGSQDYSKKPENSF